MKTKLIALTIAALFALSLAAGCGAPAEEPPADDPNGEPVDEHVGEQLDWQIQGIDPGAGLMGATFDVLDAYGLDDWELIEASDAAMTAALQSAYNNQEPIIVTGWTPHWKFSAYDLKYLDDPQGIYGDEEQIHTLVRQGLEDDHPSAFAFLDNFYWTPDDMNTVMLDAQDADFETAAADWVAANSATVDEWVDGIDPVDGDSIDLAFVAWDSELASTNVVAVVLEERLGYDVIMTQLDPGAMFTAVSRGDSDAMVAAWLPTTHADYYSRFEGDFVDLGPNLDGTLIGLVVPAYMDIDSIEDLAR